MKLVNTHRQTRSRRRDVKLVGLAASALLAVTLTAGRGVARAGDDDHHDNDHRYCSATASLQLEACRHETSDELNTAQAICINLSERQERKECRGDAKEERREGSRLCAAQYRARRDLCDALGEDRYDPDFDPAGFDADFTNLTNPNPHFPLSIGNQWTYGGAEDIVVEVLNKTKLIAGVTCIVVNDRVELGGEVLEDTDDWFAQATDGNVLYCGEEVKDFETFPGDNPAEPELIEIAGSFKVGRDGAKPGTVFPINPFVGMVYRQEWAAGNAEDAARVLSTTYDFGDDPELDEFMPEAVADLLCNNDCIVNAEFSPIDPDAFELKYYAPGIGLFLGVKPDDGEVVQLAGCNFDARCAQLPAP